MRITAEAKTATRERIIKVAAKLFAKKGYDTTTTRDIASKAGIAAGTLFNYFGSKEEAVAGELPVLPDQAHIDAFITDPGDLLGGICELLAASVGSDLEDHEIARLRKDVMTRYPHLTASRMEGFRQFEEDLIAVVVRRLAAQHPDVAPATRERDARLATYVALAATRHAWMSWAASDDPSSSLLDGLRRAFADLERLLRTSGAN